MPGTTRYNGNHNNLLLSLGALTPEEKKSIKQINLTHTGRPRLILEICRMNAGKWITLEDLQQVNPHKFSGEFARDSNRSREMFRTITKYGLVEHNPENPQQFRATPFGIKYLYCKKLINNKR